MVYLRGGRLSENLQYLKSTCTHTLTHSPLLHSNTIKLCLLSSCHAACWMDGNLLMSSGNKKKNHYPLKTCNKNSITHPFSCKFSLFWQVTYIVLCSSSCTVCHLLQGYTKQGGGVDKEGREGEGGHVTMCINVSPSLQFMRIYFYID